MSSSTSTSGTGGGATTSTGTGSPLGHCERACAKPADCCETCPGPTWPENFTCVAGICHQGECASNNECSLDGAVPGQECHPLMAFKTCMTVCSGDADCASGQICSGVADDQAKYCIPTTCAQDADCEGSTCHGGVCGCTTDSECSGPFVNTCVH
jgi:hypothetical protein